MARLIYSCVLTRDIERLDAFYRAVLQLEPRSRAGYREFATQPGVFSLWSVDEYDQITGGDAAHLPAGGTVMFEFQVDDVDAEFARLQSSSYCSRRLSRGATVQSTFAIPMAISSISSLPSVHSPAIATRPPQAEFAFGQVGGNRAQLALRHSGKLAQIASRFATDQL
jgi:predicted enzyme related to lactoylglutathione lyase